MRRALPGLLMWVAGGIAMAAFSRWLQHKEKMGQLIAEQTAEKAAQYATHVDRLESRLRVVEQLVTDSGAETAAQIEALREKGRITRATPQQDGMAG